MRKKWTLVFVAMVFPSIAWCLAADLHMGTWRLNEARSKLDPRAGTNSVVVYSWAGDKVKIVVDGVDKDGQPTHNEWIGKFDGKDYPVLGDPTSDTRAYSKVDEHTLELTVKKAGR